MHDDDDYDDEYDDGEYANISASWSGLNSPTRVVNASKMRVRFVMHDQPEMFQATVAYMHLVMSFESQAT